jgi:hypothetical protein
MSYTENDINQKALCVLSVDSDGKFQADYLPIQIDTNLSESIRSLRKRIDERIMDKNLTKQEIYNIKMFLILEYWQNIQMNHTYLLGYRNYCSSISSSYISAPGILKESKIEFLPFSQDPDLGHIMISNQFTANYLTTIDAIFSASFFNSYFIEQAYKECKNNSNIKAYSHRRLGWESYNFDLNKIFSVNIKTNFGYGYANYFCATLVFDGIQIIPYSRLVIYRNANFMQLIRNTWDFHVQDYSWALAFNMVKDACNSYQQDGQNNFVKKYFVDELENLTKKLSEYLRVNRFELSENQYGNYVDRNEEKKRTIDLNGFPLIVFRGEKVSGALGFVESILKISKIMPIQKYIDTIINCCKTVIPQLNNAINELNIIIKKLGDIYKTEFEKKEFLEKEYETYKPTWDSYNEIENNKKKEVYENNKENSEVSSIYSKIVVDIVIEQMSIEYPFWENIKNEFSRKKKAFEDQSSKCAVIESDKYIHESYLTQISKYKEDINHFLEKE